MVVYSHHKRKLLGVDVSYCQMELLVSHYNPVAEIQELVDFENDIIAAIPRVRRARTAVQILIWIETLSKLELVMFVPPILLMMPLLPYDI